MTRGLVALCAGAVVSCASAQPPHDKMEGLQRSLATAEALGGSTEPKAALHMQLSHEQLEKARKLIESGDHENAERCLTRAHADAELAVAYAQGAEHSKEAADARDKLDGVSDTQRMQ